MKEIGEEDSKEQIANKTIVSTIEGGGSNVTVFQFINSSQTYLLFFDNKAIFSMFSYNNLLAFKMTYAFGTLICLLTLIFSIPFTANKN